MASYLDNVPFPPVVQEWIERIGGPRRAALLAVGVGSVLLILVVARWATAPTWVPIYSGLSIENVGVITERLDEERIRYRLDQGGSELRVTTGDLARARVALAREGMPLAGRPGLELFDQPAWGMTDFTQRVNYRRALEGELERTIMKMREVETAKVHVAMEEAVGFRRAGRPSQASVVLRLRGGTPPSPDMVQGIAHLVSSSVDGVDAERVMVLDDRGRLLSDPSEPGSPTALASRELKMRADIEQYLAARAEQLVAQIVGPGNVRVQVSADINLDRIERTMETVDPDRQVLSSEQRSEIIPGPEGGAGSSTITSSFLNTRTLETFSGAVGNVRRLTAAVLVNDRVVVENGVTERVARTPQELAQIEALVASAMGADVARGDQVTVVSFAFDEPVFEVPPTNYWALLVEFHRPLLALLALILTFFIALRVTRSLQTPSAAEEEETRELEAARKLDLLVGGEGGEGLGEGEEALAAVAAWPEEPALPRGPTERDIIAKQVETDPDVVVKLIRAWIKED